MPNKNSRKKYVAGGVYHVYSRGVEKRIIFLDEEDYNVFTKYLRCYLVSPNDLEGYGNRISVNFEHTIELYGYCLMPNHFHLILKQNEEDSVKRLLHSLLTRYTIYFNKKYKRVGGLFQGRFRAIAVTTDEYLLHLIRYIVLNPEKIGKKYFEYPYSSYSYYVSSVPCPWIETRLIEEIVGGKKQFLDFLGETAHHEQEEELFLGDMTLDGE